MPPNQPQTYEQKVVRLRLGTETAEILGNRWMTFQGIFKILDEFIPPDEPAWTLYEYTEPCDAEFGYDPAWVLTFRRPKPIIPTESVLPTEVLENWDLLNVCGCGTVVLSTLVGSKPCKICQILGDSSSGLFSNLT